MQLRTMLNGVTGGLVVAMLSSTCLAADGPLMLPRGYSTGVPLVTDGRTACAIIYPAEEADGRRYAERVASAVSRLGGGAVDLVPDVQAVPERLGQLRTELRDRPLILLGDLNTNRAFSELYANYYTLCDARYPGGDGYVLRTLVRPFGREVNHLVVGASTSAGLGRGVDRLTALLSEHTPAADVELPYIIDVELGGPTREAFADALAWAETAPPFERPVGKGHTREAQQQFRRNAHLYFYTGLEFYAARARDWMKYQIDYSPEPIGTNDYVMESLAHAWRRVSVSEVFSPEERQEIDIRLYGTFLAQGGGFWVTRDASTGIGCRHHTTGMLAWWTLLRVLTEVGRPGEQAAEVLATRRQWCKSYLDGLLRHYWDDQDDYQSADSAQNIASYALQSGQLEWYRNGLARRAAQRLMAKIDNMGWNAGIQGYGDALPGWERFTLSGGLLLGSCAFVYQDGGYLWILDRFPALQRSWGSLQPWRLRTFDVGDRLEREPPDWLSGLYVARLTPYRLDLHNTGEFLTTQMMDGFHPFGLKVRPVTPELAYDKLTYRSTPAPDGTYFLVQGMAGTSLSTVDPNTIIRLADQGKLWLIHNTGRLSLYFKNGVYVTRGDNEEPIPAACELVANDDFGSAALAATRLPDYRGTAWTRNLITLKERFVVAIDQVRIEQPGAYMVGCNWRTPAYAALEDAAWTARQDDVSFHLLAADPQGMTSRREFVPDGATRPTILRQNRSLAAKPGDEVVFENLLYTTSPARPVQCQVRRVAPGVMAIQMQQDDASPAIYVAAAGDRGIESAGFTSDASTVLVGAEEVWMVGGQRMTLAGMDLKCDEGHLAFSPEQARAARAWLAEVWDRAEVPHADPGQVQQTADRHGTPAWTYNGLPAAGWRMDGVRFMPVRHIEGLSLLATDWMLPLLLAEPRLRGQQGTGLEPPIPGQQITVEEEPAFSEPRLDPLVGAEFILKLPEQAEVTQVVLYGDTFGETDEPPPPAHLELELSFSTDDFAADTRTHRVRVTREASYHNLYKGHCYLFERYRAAGFQEKASTVRVRVVDASIERMVLTDLRVRVASPSQPQDVRVRTFDLDGSGDEDIVAWTTDGDLAVLSGDGQVQFTAAIDEGIIAVDAWDLDEDGQREIFVSRTDRQVAVYNLDGSTRWIKDYRNMWRDSDQHFFFDGSAVYGMGVWKPITRPRPEVIFTGYWFSTRLEPDGQVIEWFRRPGHFTEVRSVPADMPNGGGLVMRSDIPWIGPVPLEWWSLRTGTADTKVDVPNGPARMLDVADFSGDGHAEALVATEQGIGLFGRTAPRERWQRITGAPTTGVGIIDRPEGSGRLITYAREDGYIFVMTPSGDILRETVLDEPVRCLTALRTADGNARVWVGTPTRLIVLDFETLEELWQQDGGYQWLDLLRNGNVTHVLAVTTTGRLEVLEP